MENPKIVMDMYELIRWMIPAFSKFPKNQRYLLAQRIEDKMLDILEDLVEARDTRDKTDILKRVNLSLEQTRFLVRLCHDFQFISPKRYEYCSERMDNIGNQLGGWLKQQSRPISNDTSA